METLSGGPDSIILNAVPEDISADGAVVVGTYNNPLAYKLGVPDSGVVSDAFLWTETGGAVNLQEHLEDEYGLLLPGWTLESATGISADGTVIAGYGLNPAGDREAWVVDLAAIPEPSAVSLLLFAVLIGLTPRNKACVS